MDKEGINPHTISLFRDGIRCGKAMPLPESFKGKALCPHVMYKNISLHVNFGPEPLEKLSFECRMLDTASKADVTTSPKPEVNRGKHEVIFPVFLPDEGAFE